MTSTGHTDVGQHAEGFLFEVETIKNVQHRGGKQC